MKATQLCVRVCVRVFGDGMCGFDAGSHSSHTDKIGSGSSSSSRDRDMDTFGPYHQDHHSLKGTMET